MVSRQLSEEELVDRLHKVRLRISSLRASLQELKLGLRAPSPEELDVAKRVLSAGRGQKEAGLRCWYCDETINANAKVCPLCGGASSRHIYEIAKSDAELKASTAGEDK